MKTPPLLCLLLAFGLAVPAARAQFPNYPAADLVLGASDFTTAGPTSATAFALENPFGVAIDPTSGKLFVSSQDHHRVVRYANYASLTNGANAEAVLGQVNFAGTSSGATATTMSGPRGIHIDATGRLWVADTLNNRVLMFQAASTVGFGATPDRVFGQPNFTTVTAAASSSKMNNPSGVFVDADDNLWVADTENHRVLKFANVTTLGNGAAASTVLGQPDFTTSTAGTTAAKMNKPFKPVVDAAGRLWVVDAFNHRVLRFDNAASLGNGSSAIGVLGHPDFVTGDSGTSAQTMQGPFDALVDGAGTLIVSDRGNYRLLLFKNVAAKANGAAADGIIGQEDFTSATLELTARRVNISGAIDLDPTGALWVADFFYDRVLRFSPDTAAAPPKVTGKVPKSTTLTILSVKGTASDPSGVASVKFRVGNGAFRNATGTTAWSFRARLKPGKNTIEIVTVDTVGNTSPSKRLKVTRK